MYNVEKFKPSDIKFLTSMSYEFTMCSDRGVKGVSQAISNYLSFSVWKIKNSVYRRLSL